MGEHIYARTRVHMQLRVRMHTREAGRQAGVQSAGSIWGGSFDDDPGGLALHHERPRVRHKKHETEART